MAEPVVFGRYLLLERIAAGGMAEVFKSKSYGVAGFEKLLVIKKILPHLAANERFVSMFIKEAKIAVNLNHKNVVQVFDLGKVAEDYYIAMEYVHGRDLREITRACAKKRIPLPLSLACYLLAEIAAGLDYAHRRKDLEERPLNIIHMDISPQNVLVSFEGDVKIADFGIAHAVGGDGKMKGGVLRGKYAYMSPEMATGKPVDQRTDIFSAGVILHELITGRRLFYEQDEVRTIENVRKAIVPPPSSINPQVPPKLEAVAMRALSADPDKRYQTAEELRADLTEVLFGFTRVVDSGDLARFLKKVFAKEAGPAPGVSDLANLINDLSRLGNRPPAPIGDKPSAGAAPTVLRPPAAAEIANRGEVSIEKKIADEPTLTSGERAMKKAARGEAKVEKTESSVPAIPASALEASEPEAESDLPVVTGAVPEPHGTDAGESSAIPLTEDEIVERGEPAARVTARPSSKEPTAERPIQPPAATEAPARGAGFDFTLHVASQGQEISIVGERKRVALLAFRMFEGDRPARIAEPRGTELALVVRRFGGTLASPRGDVQLAYFGVPIAQEDDLERALSCAMETIRAERRAQLRDPKKPRGIAIAVHTGTVAVEGPAQTGRMAALGPPQVTGAPLLLVEQLVKTSPPGKVIASRSVVRGAHRRYEFVKIEPNVDKETGMTLERHAMVEPSAHVATRFAEEADQAPLVGRVRELGILIGVLAKVQRGHGQVLALVGEAGSGKSRLVRELARRVGDKELGFFTARAAPFGQVGDYALIAELIASIVGFIPEDTVDDRREKLMRLSELGLEKHEVHFVGELAGTRFDGSGLEAFDAQARRLGMFAALRKAIERLAKERPLILVFEDLQYADPLSRDALEFILDAVPERRLLVFLTYRPDFKHRWWDRAWYNQIILKPLSADDSLALARACFAKGSARRAHADGGTPDIRPDMVKLPKKLGQVILETAGGNPMFTEELCDALVRSAKVSIAPDGMIKLGGDVRRLEVPPTLRATVAARIDRLNPDLKKLLHVASVLGRKFPYRALLELSGMGDRVDGALVELQRGGFLVEIAEGQGELSYGFRHAMMREVAYHALPTSAKRKLHRSVAEYLVRTAPAGQMPVEALALHYEQAEDVDRAVEFLEKAGDKQADEFHDSEALSYYRRARDLLAAQPELTRPTRTQLASLGLKIGRAAARLGWAREAEEALKASDALARELADSVARAWAMKELGELWRTAGSYEQAQEALAEAQQLADRAQLPRLRFEILEAQGNLWAWTGRPEVAERELKKALTEAKKLQDPSLVARILVDLGALQRRSGAYDAAAEYLNRAEEVARREEDRFLLSRVLVQLGTVAAARGRDEEAEAKLREALDLSKAMGDPRGAVKALHDLGEIHARLGDSAKARFYFAESDTIAQEIGWKSGELANKVFLAWLRAQDGNPKEGRAELETAVADSVKHGSRDAQARGKFFLGRLLSEAGERKRAKALLDEARILAEEIGNRQLVAEIDAVA